MRKVCWITGLLLALLLVAIPARALASESSGITDVRVDGTRVTAIFTTETDCTLYGALYDGDGKMLDAASASVSAGETKQALDLAPTIPGAERIKVLLTDPRTVQPLCGAMETSLEEAAAGIFAVQSDDGTVLTFYNGFPQGSSPEDGRTWRVEDSYYTSYSSPDASFLPPWDRDRLETVVFAEDISPASTACWFYNCRNLTSIQGIEHLDTGSVTSMRSMFSGCQNLTRLDLSSLDTGSVTDMCGMFFGCFALTELDLSGFDTANVKDMEWMFYTCLRLRTIYVSDSFTVQAASGAQLFDECAALVGGSGTAYSKDHTGIDYARIDGPDAPGYFTDRFAPAPAPDPDPAPITDPDPTPAPDPDPDPLPSPSAEDILTVADRDYSLGMTVEALTDRAGTPDEILPSTAGHEWYVYGTDDYRNFFAAGVYDGRVVRLVSAGSGFTYMGHTAGDTDLSDLPRSYGVDLFRDKNDGGILHAVMLTDPSFYLEPVISAQTLRGESVMNFHLTNAFRVCHGLTPFLWSEQAAEAARLHSQDMVDNDYFEHKSLDGRTSGERMEAQGISWHFASENIFTGGTLGIDAYNVWVNSEGHRNNMLSDRQNLGVGAAYDSAGYGLYMTQDFFTGW